MSVIAKLFGKKESKPDSGKAPSDPIDAFWKWWPTVEAELAATFAKKEGLSESQVKDISTHVKAMHQGLAWETGPGKNSDYHLAVSSDGDAELRVLTQRWASRAPAPSSRWEFHPARQASGRTSSLTMRIPEGEVSFADFRIATTLDEHRACIDLEVFHPIFDRLDENRRGQPLFIFLDDLLGEDDVSSWIGAVDAVLEEPAGATSPGALVEQLAELKRNHDEENTSMLEGELDGAPHLVVIRLGLKKHHHLLHDHHYELTLHIQDPTEVGLYASDEGDALNALEDELIEAFEHRVIWIGHETGARKRIVHFHAAADPAIQDEMESICASHGSWERELNVSYDPAWEILYKF